MAKPNENEIYKEIKDFILSLENTDEDLKDISSTEVFFSYGELGGLYLSDIDSKKYYHCLSLILSIINENLISKKEVEVIFQKTILTVLDINNKQSGLPFADRLSASIKELRKKIKGEPIAYDVYYQIQGLSEEGLPFTVGNVQFCKFDKRQLSRFTNGLKAFQGDEDEKKKREDFADILSDAEINNKIIGIVEKVAVDPLAAKINAIKEIKITIDVINFFSDLIPYNIENNGFIYLPGEYGNEKINVPIITKGDKPSITISYESAGPYIPFSFPMLLNFDKKYHTNFKKISMLLKKQQNDLEIKIVSAIQWAGKATTAKNKEESFLLYAISLESLILPEDDNIELSDRLATRVAHVIGNNLHNRMEIKDEMKKLYGIRSKIVHSGYYQISDSDLNTIRVYAKNCIIRILTKRPFVSMNSKKELIDWFNNKIMG